MTDAESPVMEAEAHVVRGALSMLCVPCCLLLALCAQPSPAEPASSGGARSRPESTPPPIVLISIDTLRSDRLPAYGYDSVETPAIDRLRRDGILFERAYSHVPLTLPSHASMFTGQLPTEHGVRDNQGYPLTADETVLPQRLQDAGYATAGAISAYVLHRQSGFGVRGFDLYDDDFGADDGATTLGGIDRPGHQTLDAVLPWLEAQQRQPFFLFLHLFEPHLPHTPPEPFSTRYGPTYEGEIAAADDVVGRLLKSLDDLGIYDDAVILLLSDHGEGLGDHGEQEHGILLYREALQVPLLIKLPGQTRRGTTVTAPVQLVDVYPTLLAVAGLPLEPDDAEHAPRNLLQVGDDDAHRPIYSETYYPRLHYGWSELTSLIQDRHHLIAGPDPEMYDLVDDPAQRHNVLSAQRRRAGEMRDVLVTLQRPLTAPQEVDESTRQRLAALGYLGGSTSTADGPLPDPKTQLPSLSALRDAQGLLQAGKVDEAIKTYRRLLQDQPRLLDGWHALGDLLRRHGRHGEAAEAYGRAADLSGGSADFLAATLASQIAAGQLDVARRGLLAATHLPKTTDQLLRRQLAAALTVRSLAALETGASEADVSTADVSKGARQDAEHALELHPSSWDTLYQVGSAALDAGQLDWARTYLTRFVDDAPDLDEHRLPRRRAKVLLRRIERQTSAQE